MAKREQKAKPAPQSRTEEVVADQVASEDEDTKRERVKAETDAFLDEVDDLLADLGLNSETEAQAFVANYQQKGGQ